MQISGEETPLLNVTPILRLDSDHTAANLSGPVPLGVIPPGSVPRSSRNTVLLRSKAAKRSIASDVQELEGCAQEGVEGPRPMA